MDFLLLSDRLKQSGLAHKTTPVMTGSNRESRESDLSCLVPDFLNFLRMRSRALPRSSKHSSHGQGERLELPVPGSGSAQPSENNSATASNHTTSIVEGGFVAILYVTLTMPGTFSIISRESSSRISKESRVGDAVRASTLSQQRTSIC